MLDNSGGNTAAANGRVGNGTTFTTFGGTLRLIGDPTAGTSETVGALTVNAGPRQWVWTDMIDQALWFEVSATDFYGNGKLPNPDWGRFLVRSQWSGGEA